MRSFLSVLLLSILIVACSGENRDLKIPDPALVQYGHRGKDLVRSLAACGSCHGQSSTPDAPLSGGMTQVDEYGEVAAPNISPSQSGIGSWSTTETIRAIRASEGKGGVELSPSVHRGYEWMSDEDAISVVSYLKSLEPFDHEVSRRNISFVDKNTTGFFSKAKEVRGYVPAIDKKHTEAYGRYLVDNIARCTRCHSTPETLFGGGEYLAGGREVHTSDGVKVAPALKGGRYGVANWSEEAIIKYLKTGITPDNSQIDVEACPTNFYAEAQEEDLKAIAKYLRTMS